jgi:hypothetical protein
MHLHRHWNPRHLHQCRCQCQCRTCTPDFLLCDDWACAGVVGMRQSTRVNFGCALVSAWVEIGYAHEYDSFEVETVGFCYSY